MRIDVFTIFPQLVDVPLADGVIGRARRAEQVDLRLHDPRDHTTDNHRSVDDSPFGGGAGMVLSPGPLAKSIEAADLDGPLIAMSAGGERFDQQLAEELAASDGFGILCGRYEGIDQRIIDRYVEREVSIGDYVLAGGEAAAVVIVEAVTRLVPGVLGNNTSILDESFSDGLLEYPHYTRPADFGGARVPEVLTSGNHAAVARWRLAKSLARTIELRPDLVERRGGLTPDEVRLLEELNEGEQPTA